MSHPHESDAPDASATLAELAAGLFFLALILGTFLI